MNYWLLITPVIAALIGWICFQISVSLLFQQIIPKRQAVLASQIGTLVSSQFSFSGIEQKIKSPENVKKIMPLVEVHIDDFLRHKLKAKMPMIGMLIGDKTINSLKEVFLKEIEELFPQVLSQFAGNIQNELDIETMVADKIKSVPIGQMKKGFAPALKYFGLVAIISGFIIGLVNLGIFLLLN
jgi:uncharacterized membrane protein YheB (UPF0754 family)